MKGRNPAASVRARLLNKARADGMDFQLLLTRYGLERLLYRLSISPERDNFLLKGALLFDRPFREWIAQALPADKFELVPLSPAIAAEAFDLPGDFHADPFDCLIVATARNLEVTLVTSDEAIRDYPHVKRRTFSPRKPRGPRRSVA